MNSNFFFFRTMLELINQLDGFDPRGNIKVCLMRLTLPNSIHCHFLFDVQIKICELINVCMIMIKFYLIISRDFPFSCISKSGFFIPIAISCPCLIVGVDGNESSRYIGSRVDETRTSR